MGVDISIPKPTVACSTHAGAFEPLFQELRRRVHEALETVAELEQQEGPKIEARILERMWEK
jgi:hypothetical protein